MTMKKIISIIVSCVLVMTAGVVSSFAAEAQDTSGTSATERFNDVEGTPYETAVEYLVEKVSLTDSETALSGRKAS